MTQCNTLNVKLSNSQLNKLKSGKNGYKVTLKVSSNVIGDSNDENNFPHKLLLNNTETLRIRKVFANNSSTNIELSKNSVALNRIIRRIFRYTFRTVAKIWFVFNRKYT